MKSRIPVRIADAGVILIVGYFVVHGLTHRAPKVEKDQFAASVDLKPMRDLAIHDVGRIKSFDSYANSMIRSIAGPYGIEGEGPVYAYLDLMLNRDEYRNRKIIYMKKAIRQQVARAMEESGIPVDDVRTFIKDGMISEQQIFEPKVLAELQRMDTDVLRTAKFVNMVNSALMLADPHELSARMRVVPPPDGDQQKPWIAGEDVWGLDFLGDGHAHGAAGPVPGLSPELQKKISEQWSQVATAWKAKNADAASQAIAALAGSLRSVDPTNYPPQDKLSLESWYFRWHAFVWNWIVYIIAVVPLLLSVIYRWRGAYRAGILLVILAFGIHTASLGIRWYLSGRIPNSNMFEAVLAATWFGVLGAFFIEVFVRKTAMRGLFFLGSSVCAMVAMMCQHFMPTTLRSDIDNVMPVLDDVWLYIHTNVIIWSYALIGMAAITALLYLRHRLGGGDPTVAKAGGAGSLILNNAPGKGDSFLREDSATWGQVLDASTMVLMELSFVMLWAGLVMGAIWADHSWGRPWGWDPKEVFALCTFVIFMILLHVRFKVRDKGFWTAVLAVAGCGVMLFNWIVINFKISGLHSYA
ncbi:MAG: cytochrome c biogenesis protein CcsA [Phycisphaerales bacterium]|nr:cytochrome c biogenesis protein CcsA [Phycisphaerales bacterium]